MSKSATFHSYAKLNLRLKLQGRYANGYHALDMLNVTLDLADIITIELLDYPEIICDFKDSMSQPLHELNNVNTNLVARAVKMVSDLIPNRNFGVKISCIKNIPLGSGLGGGSSNAACIIKNLPELLCNFGHVNQESLATIRTHSHEFAYKLGSDIFYFLHSHGGIAQVTGVGDTVSQLSDRCPIEDLILCLPSYGINSSTVYFKCKEIYKDLPLLEKTQKPKEDLATSISTYESLLGTIDNDLFKPACVVQPQLLADLSNISKNSDCKVGLSGSGSSIFLIPNKSLSGSFEIPPMIAKYAKEHAIKLINVKVLANFH